MVPMSLSTTLAFAGWATGVADCDGDVTIEYFDEDGVSQGSTLPANWVPTLQGEEGPSWTPTHVALTFTSPTDIDFSDGQFMSVSINGNLTLTGSGYAAGREVWLKITETGGSSRTLAKPSGWVVVGGTFPSSLAANKTLLVHLIAYGGTEASVVAHTWVQS
jgi:hypothetical protein